MFIETGVQRKTPLLKTDSVKSKKRSQTVVEVDFVDG